MLGYYQFNATSDVEQRRRALSVMELAEPHFPNTRLRIEMAKAHIALGNPVPARALLQLVLSSQPAKDERDDATRLLQGLPE
jgi:hypothetical protein